jgi:hypothetical protein
MFSIKGTARQLCDGTSRRDFLRIGALGGLGVFLPGLLHAASASSAGNVGFGRARRCVLLFLTGGPPQLDTWDLKPDAVAEVRGELRPIATCVPGIQISELFPRLARQADKYCIVRSVTHQCTVHTPAGYAMLTGAYHPQVTATSAKQIRPSGDDHPHLGSLLAHARGRRGGVPTFVSLPEVIKDDAVNDYPGQGAGFLGNRYEPFRVHAEADNEAFRVPDLVLPPEMSAERLENRRALLPLLDRHLRAVDARGALGNLEAHYQQAYDLIRSPAVQRAFQFDREPDRVRSAYGRHLFGQGCLLARRLLEAGVALVTVYWHYEGPQDSPVWDTHANNFRHLRQRLMPPTDQAFASLLDDLAGRGLLDDTLVVCMGEFGRSPRINSYAGRDHWPFVQSIVLAGAGIRGGSTYGASDRQGAQPADKPVTPPNLVATLLHLLGVQPDLEVHDRAGRPLRACAGEPLRGLLA